MSELEVKMIQDIPAGGNWRHIPSGLSDRVDQIKRRSRDSGIVHTTYYGRLRSDRPAYTINTYFSRIGNGCFLHPEQKRLISIREGARLQSFPDNARFVGSRRAICEQVGNAVPPLLALAVARSLPRTARTFADLFSGAGGLSIGFEMAGLECLYAADRSVHACEAFNLTHERDSLAVPRNLEKAAERVEVASEILERAGGAVDVLVAGPPCQSFSTAGKRTSSDDRSALIWAPFDVARLVEPEILIVENVQGILSSAERSIPGRIFDEMSRLGFEPSMHVLRAEEYGVPQRRTRVIFVGLRGAAWAPPEPLYARDDQSLLLPPPVTVAEAINDLPPLSVGGGTAEATLQSDANSEFQRWARGEITVTEMHVQRVERLGFPPNADW